LNKGTAFTAEERVALRLTGLLPAAVTTIDAQASSAYVQFELLPDSLSKNNYLTSLHDRNEVLFYRLFSDHLREMIPIVNDVTVGLAMEQYRHECRPPRGLYLSIDHLGSIEEAFDNFGVEGAPIDLILATDAEHIPGVGDWGVGGMEVAIGKLAVYTATAGIDPSRVIPVMLDVGTNRQSLLNDPSYIGNRHPRVRGPKYDEFIDAYVRAASRRFPNALFLWEDFSPAVGRRILENYKDTICSFNEDLQGTGAITLAAAISAARICGTPLRKQRVVIFGAGTAGIGVAEQMRFAMTREGLSPEKAALSFWCIDRMGLLTQDMADQLTGCQAGFARPAAECAGWARDLPGGGISLAEVVRRVRPTILIGASSLSGGFTEAIIRDMAANTEKPIIFMLSSPLVRAEATPTDLISWTEGRALIATGYPFPPVTYRGLTHVIAQLDNAMLYPGLCLGAVVVQARLITNSMLAAAASAVSSLVSVRQPGASLLPHVDDLRSVSATVAVAVAEAASEDGLSLAMHGDIVQQVQDSMWLPEYRRTIAI
jgi:malate dehydrogenase (oxaloacetate-decarboxylating)